MADAETVVKRGTISLDYSIQRYDLDGFKSVKFDWILENGDESPELFDTAEDAERDLLSRY